jgi:hypothetical protein
LPSVIAAVHLSHLEVQRLKGLTKAIARAQEAAVTLQVHLHAALGVCDSSRKQLNVAAAAAADDDDDDDDSTSENRPRTQESRMHLLTRLTVGSLVVYEADAVRAMARGERLAGIIIEDLGVQDQGSADCLAKQYRVRDLLDDALVWQSPGQLRRLSPLEAPQFLRADLLPPATCGTPVTPLTAAAGQWVQLTPWATSGLHLLGDDGAQTSHGAQAKALQQVIGVLVMPVRDGPLKHL